ncbi:hypothetical protein GGQ92_000698 [Gracilibacillus halotolerans]|uniref:Transcription repressor NadR n=1 Tax=Gracilibacillus halotolerans TaxID=74386 RepID=A0A841RH11_9BACI|nr:transcription repressor NadR [Gracilibacillus halotolerans]MBB6511931.1 hypothetical protein [Gracilibacillus halotolerans]
MSKKLQGNERREIVLNWLKSSDRPLTGSELATKANVSRQVIVQDISLLKAKNHPIMATSNGYIYMSTEANEGVITQVIACKHDGVDTREELYTIVDYGCTVKDVMIEHPVYGELKASLMVSNRAEVDRFIDRMEAEQAPLLLELTGGIHNHTITSKEKWQIEQAIQNLQQKGFLLE